MPAAVLLAQEMGALLGRSEVLLGAVQKNQGGMNWNETIAGCRDAQPADEVALICGDQLNEHHSWIAGRPVSTRLFVMM